MMRIMPNLTPPLHPANTPGARVEEISRDVWHLEIPAGKQGVYRLAQLDDYQTLVRSSYLWDPPFHMSVQARASADDLPGSWGFGIWNDPFSLSLGFGGGAQRFPALPNAAWFFYASAPNYLSFRDDLPAQGFLAATFRAPRLATPWMVMVSPLSVLLVIPAAVRLARWMLRKVIQQSAQLVETDPTTWHSYELEWEPQQVRMSLDGQPVLATSVAPCGPLGLVLWIDNQYAALPPGRTLKYGFLSNPSPAWIELSIQVRNP